MSWLGGLLKSSVIERFVRATGSTALVPILVALFDEGSVSLDTVLAVISGNPWIVAATPLLMAAFKAARMKWPESKFWKYLTF